ncbi:hypothetical protein QBC43DRAFT_246115 [Cladorrhinum sp. PSN259]|nr:hypothetical protein QBC43DRAFT_246115 [Cladorrhinum sp. PSN259]
MDEDDGGGPAAAAKAKYGDRTHVNIRTVVDGNDEEAQLLSSSALLPDSDSDSDSDLQEIVGSNSRPNNTKSSKLSRQHRITTALVLPKLQAYPHSLLTNLLPSSQTARTILLIFYLLFLSLSTFLPISLNKSGLFTKEGEQVHHLSCTTSLLPFKACDLNLDSCRHDQAFSNHSFTFRCPAGCESVRVLNEHYVGEEEVVYKPWVIGGGEGKYRGDSFLCQAGIHASVIGAKGGCGRVVVGGEYYRFVGNKQNGIEGIEFDGWYPVSFEVNRYEAGEECEEDRRWGFGYWITVLGTVMLAWCTTDARVMFWVTAVFGFVWVSLAGDPPDLEMESRMLMPSLLSIGVGRWVPGLFCLAVVWLFVGKRTLKGLPAEVGLEKSLLWVGAFWVGALVNSTIEPMIPLARLTKHDLEQQPGAVVGLVVIVGVILGVAVLQAYHFWREGRFRRYIIFYIGLILGLGLLAMLPGLELRIHHYILALLLLPGTSMQTRPSLLFQGLLVGIFVNGVARWGFDSLLQTADMLRGDGEYGSLLPGVKMPLVHTLADAPVESISFSWDALPMQWTGVGWDILQGISVMVNDVERYRGWFSEKALEDQLFTWYRGGDMMGKGVRTNEYFRFGFIGEGGELLDYTKAGVWYLNGTWSY